MRSDIGHTHECWGALGWMDRHPCVWRVRPPGRQNLRDRQGTITRESLNPGPISPEKRVGAVQALCVKESVLLFPCGRLDVRAPEHESTSVTSVGLPRSTSRYRRMSACLEPRLGTGECRPYSQQIKGS